ncbi:MAG: tRNA lysidine(34) synthetase TilS [Candidatus Saccharibacteria bacterium]|nr:tRNA lysidine(34) synthetase TilS [Candidatus Saccharibacteria bacterium]
MKKILAVSGGIDSMVMLFLFKDDPDAVVAHFDHGIRESSAADCAFVERVAKEYGKDFYFERANLGQNCSEESARVARYRFLRRLAKELNGKIYTAHHVDDARESAVINLLRGTGWRGLAVLNNDEIEHPLINWEKQAIYECAARNNIRFRLDQTNSDEKYLRNRVREALRFVSDEQKYTLSSLIFRQRELAHEIDAKLASISDEKYPRSLVNIDTNIASEILRAILARQNISLTRPQTKRAISAIRNYGIGKQFSLNKEKFITMGRYHFWITGGKHDKIKEHENT